MLVACRLARLSALEGHCAGVDARTQCAPTRTVALGGTRAAELAWLSAEPAKGDGGEGEGMIAAGEEGRGRPRRPFVNANVRESASACIGQILDMTS
jgi:hypothetical protein